MKINSKLIILLSCLATPSYAEKIYTWQDENGVTHFSQDKPKGKSAKLVDFEAPPPVDALPAPHKSTVANSSSNKSENMISGNWITQPNIGRQATLILKPNGLFSYKRVRDTKNSTELSGNWVYEEGFLMLKGRNKIIIRRGKSSTESTFEEIDGQVLSLTKDKLNVIIDDTSYFLMRF
ncbi:DUF4124 domain-containing protein [Motilimonas pumila]|nr:DUF4124 domain-containing protein [Motilimonas pumila]